MFLPKEAIKEFQKIHEHIYSEKLSYEEAEKEALRVFLAVEAVYKPIKKDWLKILKNKNVILDKNKDNGVQY